MFERDPVFVHRDIKASSPPLLERVAKMVVGDPTDPNTDVGALISEDTSPRCSATSSAAEPRAPGCVAGGDRRHDRRWPTGYFVQPTVFDDCSDDMTIVREEIFGPVMTVLEFDDEDEVVARANDTPFGLAGACSRVTSTAPTASCAASTPATTWINTYNITPIELPFGGVKQSGIGRENGAGDRSTTRRSRRSTPTSAASTRTTDEL